MRSVVVNGQHPFLDRSSRWGDIRGGRRVSTSRLRGRDSGESSNGMTTRMTWPQLQRSDEFRGRWVALDDCRYDAKTAQPVEGSVVDADEDLVELCSRIQEGDNRHCAILFCDPRASDLRPPSARAPSFSGLPTSRAFTH